MLEFLVVGGAAFVVDALVYNLLVFGPGAAVFGALPLVAKVLAIVVATVASYLGNRLLTYRDRGSGMSWRAFGLFVLLNVAAMVLQLGCLAFSRYVLGLDDVVADNVWGTLIGQTVATAFRYVTYGRFVFRKAAA